MFVAKQVVQKMMTTMKRTMGRPLLRRRRRKRFQKKVLMEKKKRRKKTRSPNQKVSSVQMSNLKLFKLSIMSSDVSQQYLLTRFFFFLLYVNMKTSKRMQTVKENLKPRKRSRPPCFRLMETSLKPRVKRKVMF